MRATRIGHGRLVILTLLVLALFLLPHATSAINQLTFVKIVSYRVNGAPDYNAPGNESFWSGISWTNVSLVASVTPGGGNTSSVLVRSANDGFNIYLLFRWKDAQGPSYGSSSEAFVGPGGQLKPLDPANTTSVNKLFFNSTYYYPDRVAMLWYMGNVSQRDQTPRMRLGTNGALSAGVADIWHWQSNPTDNSPSDSGFPGGYTDPRGKLIFPPNNVSFAEDDYTNATGYFPIAGNVSGTPNLDPYGYHFIVQAGNYFSPANKTWTVEMVRPLAVSQDARYRVQLTTGSRYFVGFAVWNGRMGESSHIKSVSQWYNFTITNQAPSLAPAPVGGVSPTLAISVGAGLLVVGLIIGAVVKPRTKQPKG